MTYSALSFNLQLVDVSKSENNQPPTTESSTTETKFETTKPTGASSLQENMANPAALMPPPPPPGGAVFSAADIPVLNTLSTTNMDFNSFENQSSTTTNLLNTVTTPRTMYNTAAFTSTTAAAMTTSNSLTSTSSTATLPAVTMATSNELANQQQARSKGESLGNAVPRIEGDVEMKSERPESPVDITNSDNEATGVGLRLCHVI